MHTQNTWGLSTDWDLQFDANGKPEVLTEAQAITQNVCNECRLFCMMLTFATKTVFRGFLIN